MTSGDRYGEVDVITLSVYSIMKNENMSERKMRKWVSQRANEDERQKETRIVRGQDGGAQIIHINHYVQIYQSLIYTWWKFINIIGSM